MMDFDLSKENIQPLRGGRNATQLGVALQAQSSQEYQLELIQQKEEFEKLISNYTGDDPLENWYCYISWVEQSFPKHGHEGNLIQLLEHCLQKFEDDERYMNDMRLCKLWIKYNDLQHNPIELYQMLHAKGRCRGCADLYKAWAFYYEAAGNFQQADKVFKLGEQALAQPYEDLVIAYQNMVYAAGQQVISGVDKRRLEEERMALTCLKTYKPGRVSSIRTSTIGSYSLPVNTSVNKPNVMVPVYEDFGEGSGGAEAAPISVLSVARRSEAPKENTFKPGVWTTVPSRKTISHIHRTPAFTVHEDGIQESQSFKNLLDFFPVTHEDYSNFIFPVCCPEPADPNVIPMYPKAHVYAEPNKEYSLEEIRARKYLRRPINSLNVPHCETEQAIQSILDDAPESMQQSMHETEQNELKEVYNSPNYQSEYLQHGIHDQQVLINSAGGIDRKSVFAQSFGASYVQPSFQSPLLHNVHHDQSGHLNHSVHILPPHDQAPQHISLLAEGGQSMLINKLFKSSSREEEKLWPQSSSTAYPINSNHSLTSSHHPVIASSSHPVMASPNHPLMASPNHSVIASPSSHSEVQSMNILWRSPNESQFHTESLPIPEKKGINFAIYDESNAAAQTLTQPKGSAMKTPFNLLTDEDLAETGSRGGLDIAAAAQPIDSAKNLPVLNDDSSSSLGEGIAEDGGFVNMNTTNTQMFNFNLNAMKVSTPQNKAFSNKELSSEQAKSTKKQLFGEPQKALSTILEETKSGSTSSSSSGLKSTFLHSKRNAVATITEEQNSYDFNLAQNSKANAALRSSLLGEFMECESQQSSPIAELPPPIPVVLPSVTVPLVPAPSDPFKPSLIKTLLAKINFPGQHTYGYCKMFTTPRLNVRKEYVFVGDDKYYVEKIIGKGTYGSVYKAYDLRDEAVALKIQKPPNKWEFYICKELQARLANHPLKDRFMDIRIGYFNEQASILVSDFSPIGSLLDIANLVKQKQPKKKESLCIYFCIEMLKIISAMHKVNIIHADVKPDNFLVQLRDNNTITLQLIDFGCSIDMAMFPPETRFLRRVTTEDFICCEMRDGRPWSYHTDLFCVAATAHVLLFEKYIQMQKIDGHWSITQKFPRYMKFECWNMFFGSLLNQQAGPANPESLIAYLTNSLDGKGDLNEEIRVLVNSLKGR